MTQMPQELELIFPNPVWTATIPKWDKHKRDLSKYVSNIDYWSKPDFWKDNVETTIDSGVNVLEKFPDLLEQVNQEVYKFCSELKTANPPALKNSWINRFKQHGYMGTHKHLPHHISGVIYLNVGSLGGEFYFENAYNDLDPLLQHHAYDHKAFFNEPDIVIPPEEGRLILFKSGMPHGVKTVLDDTTRISISFNYDV